MMRKVIKLAFVFLLLQSALMHIKAIKIHTIGDSTMANYDENTTDKRGWGMMLQQFFTADVIVNNRAKSGASSKSFYLEAAYWATVKEQIESGDYVFIQFAHNDEKNGGLDGDTVRKYTDPNADYRGTTAQGTYKDYLRAYVNESKALGAIPVLVTSMCRKYFEGSTIKRKGCHDLGDDFNVPDTDHTYDYTYAMKEVATELDVELIDLTALTKELFESYGDAACTSLLFCADDSTHPNAMGGTLVARLCAQAMLNQGILASYVNASSDLLVNPSNCDFGNAYVSQTLTKELTISGFDLDPVSGTFTLSVSDGFLIAVNKTDVFASAINLDYTSGNLDFTRFYISSRKSSSGLSEGALTVSNGTTTKIVPLTANFIELTGGTEVSLFWKLSANDDYSLSGSATPIAETHNDMYVQRYAAPNSAAIWPTESTYDASRKTQRNLIIGDVWPAGDIDEVSTRYMQFGITANEGTELNIDSIGMYICGAGGNGMRCRISYSTNNFADYTVIKEFPSMVANNMYAVSAIPVVKLAKGDSLLVRVYPWYSGQATGKTICLADVTIHGMASTATIIQSHEKSRMKCIISDGCVKFLNTSDVRYVNIYNINGNLVYNSSVLSLSEVCICGLNSGFYVANLVAADGVEQMKFIIP
ncbi:GDSL-type esterase/lipase family protein [Geofilum sp. OHC36d9]|uniref:GDSL-type esterase/lipase family protein n=1 Tax=Geofilum sp. OHC36d9 TaxID=3458413 RepID=UPI0040340395